MSGARVWCFTLVVASLGWAGCAAPPVGFGIEITAAFEPSVTDAQLKSVTSLVIAATGDETYTHEDALKSAPPRVERFIYRPKSSTRSVTIVMQALDANGTLIAEGSTGILTLTPGQTLAVPITLLPPDLTDLGMPDFSTTDTGHTSEPDAGVDGGATSKTIDFLTARRTPTGLNPVAVATGDLNGDGRPDVVVAALGASKVQIFFTQAGGVLPATPSYEYTGASQPTAVATGDFNGDKNNDVAVLDANTGSTIILVGDGKGGFTAQAPVLISAGANQMVAADFDHDGSTDLAVTSTTIGAIWVAFSGGSVVTIGTHTGVKRLHAADFNADGYLDLLATETVVQLFTNTHTTMPRTFTKTTLDLDTPTPPTEATLIDANNDGAIDVYAFRAGDSTGQATIFANDGKWTPYNVQAPNAFPHVFHALAADIDGKGKADLIFTQGETSGADAEAFDVALGEDSSNGTYYSSGVYTMEDNVTDFALADLNGDGKLDIVAVNPPSNSLDVALNTGDGHIVHAATDVVGDGSDIVSFLDVDGDGLIDLVDSNNSYGIHVFRGDGLGDFSTLLLPQPVTGGSIGAALLDVDGDKILDLVLGTKQGQLAVLSGQGAGVYKAPTYATYGTNFIALASTDIDGDKKPDVLLLDNSTTANSSGKNLIVLISNGTGFATPLTYAVPSPLGFAIADVNGDGASDVVVLTTTSALEVFVNTGTGLSTAKQSAGIAAHAVGFALFDANHDGKLDIAVAGDTTHILSGQGDGTFVDAGAVYSTPSNGVAAGNIDGNGRDDLVLATDHSILVFADALAGTPLEFSAGANLHALVAYDVNRDALLDVFAMGQCGSLLLNQTK